MLDPSRAPRRWQAGRALNFLTAGLLVCSVGLNLLQDSRLKAYSKTPSIAPAIGTAAAVLEVQTLSGHPRTIHFTGAPTILYYFSPNCPWCERNWLNVKALAAATDGHYRFIGLSTVPTVQPYLDQHHLSFEVYSGITLETARKYGFGATPSTVVVSATGAIQYTWAGAYRGDVLSAVEHAFRLVLPGLLPATRPQS